MNDRTSSMPPPPISLFAPGVRNEPAPPPEEERTNPGTPNVLEEVRALVQRGNEAFSKMQDVLDEIKKVAGDVANSVLEIKQEAANFKRDSESKFRAVDQKLEAIDKKLAKLDERVYKVERRLDDFARAHPETILVPDR